MGGREAALTAPRMNDPAGATTRALSDISNGALWVLPPLYRYRQFITGRPPPPFHCSVGGPASRELMKVLVWYMRFNGLYARALPTMHVSMAHTESDLKEIGDRLDDCIQQLVADGMYNQ